MRKRLGIGGGLMNRVLGTIGILLCCWTVSLGKEPDTSLTNCAIAVEELLSRALPPDTSMRKVTLVKPWTEVDVGEGIRAQTVLIVQTWWERKDEAQAMTSQEKAPHQLSAEERGRLFNRREDFAQVWVLPLSAYPGAGPVIKAQLPACERPNRHHREIAFLGHGHGCAWYLHGPIYEWIALRDRLQLTGGDDPIAGAIRGLTITDPGSMTANGCEAILGRFGAKALPQIEKAVAGNHPATRRLVVSMMQVDDKAVTAWLCREAAASNNDAAEAARACLLHHPRVEAASLYREWLEQEAGKEDVLKILIAARQIKSADARVFLPRVLAAPTSVWAYREAFDWSRELGGKGIPARVAEAEAAIRRHGSWRKSPNDDRRINNAVQVIRATGDADLIAAVGLSLATYTTKGGADRARAAGGRLLQAAGQTGRALVDRVWKSNKVEHQNRRLAEIRPQLGAVPESEPSVHEKARAQSQLILDCTVEEEGPLRRGNDTVQKSYRVKYKPLFWGVAGLALGETIWVHYDLKDYPRELRSGIEADLREGDRFIAFVDWRAANKGAEFRLVRADRPAALAAIQAMLETERAAAALTFEDILKLRDTGKAADVPLLERVLVSNFPGTRTHGFAAAQALFRIGTPEAHAILTRCLLTPAYFAGLGAGYTSHWNMPEPQRSKFIAQYHLVNVNARDLLVVVAVEPPTRERDRFEFVVTIENFADRPVQLPGQEAYQGDLLYFRDATGCYATREHTAEHKLGPVKWLTLAPRQTHTCRIEARIAKTDPLTLETKDVRFELGKPGPFVLQAMVEQQPPSPEAPVKNPWVGRAVSPGARLEVPRGPLSVKLEIQGAEIAAWFVNDSREAQTYKGGLGMTSAKQSCILKLRAADGREWSAMAPPRRELQNYDDILVPPGDTVLIGRWNLAALRYREEGRNEQLGFQDLPPDKYQTHWWDGVFQIGAPLRSSWIEVSTLREDLSAREFAAALRGRWESVFALPGRTNITHAEFRADDTATVLVTAGDAVRTHAGSYRLEFDRPPASNMVTLAKITVQTEKGEFVLSRVNFGLHNGVIDRDSPLLRIDGNPHGALDRAVPWGEAVGGVQVRLTSGSPRCKSAPSLKLEVAVIECPEPQVIVPRTGRSFEVKVDGRWYRWGKAVDEQAVKLDALSPPMILDWCWPGPWVAIDGKEPRALVFEPGQHTIRVRLVVHFRADPDGTKQIQLLSNPVEVFVVGTPDKPAAARPGSATTEIPSAVRWGESKDGLRLGMSPAPRESAATTHPQPDMPKAIRSEADLDPRNVRIGLYEKDDAKPGLRSLTWYSRTRMPPLPGLYEWAVTGFVAAGNNELVGRMEGVYSRKDAFSVTRYARVRKDDTYVVAPKTELRAFEHLACSFDVPGLPADADGRRPGAQEKTAPAAPAGNGVLTRWHGDEKTLRVRAEVFPETFRIGEVARARLSFAAGAAENTLRKVNELVEVCDMLLLMCTRAVLGMTRVYFGSPGDLLVSEKNRRLELLRSYRKSWCTSGTAWRRTGRRRRPGRRDCTVTIV